MNQSLHPSSLIPHPLVRVFCAVELPMEVRARAADHIAQLRQAAPDVRASWERAEKMHLTLKFLGEIERSRIDALSQAAERAAKSVAPFDLAIAGTGSFPPRGVPRVLWLGVADASGGLTGLQKRLEDECAGEGFPREKRSFHPHLTIARLRTPQGAQRLAALHQEMGFEAMVFYITELVVMRSELGPGGSRYTELSRHRLNEC